MDGIGSALRSAHAERGLELTLLATADAPLEGEGLTAIRLADGRLCGALHIRGREPSSDDRRVMRALAVSLSKDIEQHLEISALRLGDRIRHVIAAGLVRSVLQPIVRLDNGQVVGLEALARFPGDPDTGPGRWFAEADGAGLGSELELVALEAGLARIGRVPEGCYLSVNVSPQTLGLDHFAACLESLPLDRLVIEITEHSPVRDYEPLRRVIDGFRARGARLAIDDAGAGFASLNHVVALHPDIIKLDISLIRGLDHDATKTSLVRSLAAFAREVGADVVAEGVESRAEQRALRQLGIEFGQGFLLGRPSAGTVQVDVGDDSRPASAIARVLDERLLDSMASELGLTADEVRALAPEARSKLWRRVAYDGLTGALQRAHGLTALDREVSRSRRHGQPLSLIFFDLNGLKWVNDRSGHAAGDQLLRAFALAAAGCLRLEDVIFRYGGDEFVCILPGATVGEAGAVVRRIRRAVGTGGMSFSSGSVQLRPADDAERLLKRADAAMYRSKRAQKLSR